jgi:hypothetical protein
MKARLGHFTSGIVNEKQARCASPGYWHQQLGQCPDGARVINLKCAGILAHQQGRLCHVSIQHMRLPTLGLSVRPIALQHILLSWQVHYHRSGTQMLSI